MTFSTMCFGLCVNSGNNKDQEPWLYFWKQHIWYDITMIASTSWNKPITPTCWKQSFTLKFLELRWNFPVSEGITIGLQLLARRRLFNYIGKTISFEKLETHQKYHLYVKNIPKKERNHIIFLLFIDCFHEWMWKS